MWGEGLPLIKVLAPYLDDDESDHLIRALVNFSECVDSAERGCYNLGVARKVNRCNLPESHLGITLTSICPSLSLKALLIAATPTG